MQFQPAEIRLYFAVPTNALIGSVLAEVPTSEVPNVGLVGFIRFAVLFCTTQENFEEQSFLWPVDCSTNLMVEHTEANNNDTEAAQSLF